MSQLVMAEGSKTRDLIRDQKIEDLRFRELRHENGGRHGNHRDFGCDTRLQFGPPTGAVVPVAA